MMTTLTSRQDTHYEIDPKRGQRLSVSVEVTLPEPDGASLDFELRAKPSLPATVEDVVWRKTKTALLQAIQDTGGVPEGGISVSVTLKLERGKWTPTLKRSLPSFIASIAASSSKAILGSRAALDPA